MTSPSSEARPRPTRLSRTPRDPQIRVVAVLSERDEETLAFLATEGFLIEQCRPDAVDRVATSSGAEALLIDADLEGALNAVSRVRKSDGVVSTLPIVLIGTPGASLRTSLDAVEAGGDAFIPRPLIAPDLAMRLHALLELPGTGGSLVPSTPPPHHHDSSSPLPPSLVPPPPLAHITAGTPGLSAGLADVLRSAALRAGGTEDDLALPSLDDDAIDELIPAELLEPLDAPLDTLGEDGLSPGPHNTPPPYSASGSRGGRGSSSRTMPAVSPRAVSPTPTITPLAVGGEMRLTGSLGRHGAGFVLGAASRSRASGLVIIRSRGVEYSLSLTSGHLLAIRSSRAEDEIGPLLARLAVIPREAARFAAAPLDAGLRGAALIAARGYLASDALAQALSRAARELTFDLLALPDLDWEMRPLETAAEIPLSPRSLDALLVLGARARVEPDDARTALGGDAACITVKADAAVIGALPLTRTERDALGSARGATVAGIARDYGADVLPAFVALAWLGSLRVEGASTSASMIPPSPVTALAQERTRVRALIECADSRDFFSLLGVSEWTARGGALDALDTRRTELSGLRARHPDVTGLATVATALDELTALVGDGAAWERYTSALRSRTP